MRCQLCGRLKKLLSRPKQSIDSNLSIMQSINQSIIMCVKGTQKDSTCKEKRTIILLQYVTALNMYNKKSMQAKKNILVLQNALKIRKNQSKLNSSFISQIVAPAGKYIIISDNSAVQTLLLLQNADRLSFTASCTITCDTNWIFICYLLSVIFLKFLRSVGSSH